MTTSGQETGGDWTVFNGKNLMILGQLAGGVLVAKASGRVDGVNAKDFQEALETMLRDNVKTLVLNLENLSYISSAGLRVILVVAKQMQGKSAKFGICSASDSINEVLQISGFDKIIPTHPTQAEAISSLGA